MSLSSGGRVGGGALFIFILDLVRFGFSGVFTGASSLELNISAGMGCFFFTRSLDLAFLA